ncbi:MAG: tetratricopeptide repeat protein [Acidobacteriota bacterium]
MPETPTPFDQGLFLAHLNRGKEHFEQRDFVEAEKELEQARRLRPADETVLNFLGIAYFKLEKYREADRTYVKLIDANPHSDVLQFNHGLICFKLGALDRAEAAFLRALDVKPDNQKVHFYLGNIYERKKEYYNAIFQYRKAGANIMVKRVQAKIDAERDAEAAGEEGDKLSVERDKTSPPEAQSDQLFGELFDTDETDDGIKTSPPTEPEVTVDHLDKQRFLTVLKASAFDTAAPSPKLEPGPGEADALAYDAGKEGSSASATPADEAYETGELIPEPAPPTSPTVVRLTDPVVSDESLTDMALSKVAATAGPTLFSAEPYPPPGSVSRDAVDEDTQKLRKLSSVDVRLSETPSKWQEGGSASPPPRRQHAVLGREEDVFRRLEHGLLEVSFSGKVFIKPGTIYSYSGNLTFWVKPQRQGGSPPLVTVTGTGKLLLSDRHREITIMPVNDEKVFVDPSHFLACEQTLTPHPAVIEREGTEQGRLHMLAIEGTGVIALSVATSPLVLTVTPGLPVNAASSSIICWSGTLTPTIVEDEALAELMLPIGGQSVNLRLAGSGEVMMEKGDAR